MLAGRTSSRALACTSCLGLITSCCAGLQGPLPSPWLHCQGCAQHPGRMLILSRPPQNALLLLRYVHPTGGELPPQVSSLLCG